MKDAETQYKQIIKELSEEAIPNNKQEIKLNNNVDELSEETQENINIEEKYFKYEEIQLDNNKNYFIVGYYQSYKYFYNCYDEIIKNI